MIIFSDSMDPNRVPKIPLKNPVEVIKNHSNGRFCVGNHRSNTYLKKIRRGFSSLSPPWFRLWT